MSEWHDNRERTVEQRFWRKVDCSGGPDACWPWTAGRAKGYGHLKVDGRMLGAHRISWELHFGPIPPGQCVLHECDNPPCQNPAHFFLGTQADNMADKVAKGRARGARAGERHHLSKLTEPKVLEIRADYAAGGVTQQELADRSEVGRRQIGKIVRGKNWRHLA